MFRYSSPVFDSRRLLILLCAKLQGKNVHFIEENPENIKAVLESSNRKGDFIERLIATPAWHPILSVESTDGRTWQRLLKAFRPSLKQASVRSDIIETTKDAVRRLHAGAGRPTILCGETVSKLCAQIFYTWIFGRSLEPAEEDLYYRASLEWRTEIAMKGAASKGIKEEFWNHLRTSYLSSDYIDPKNRGDLESQPEELQIRLSAIAQPFLISPQINFADILAALYKRLHSSSDLTERFQKALYGSCEEEDLKSFLLETIRLEHPFPVLERELTKDLLLPSGEGLSRGTQVFMMLDQFRQDPNFSPERWSSSEGQLLMPMIFGAGERACPGRHLATIVLNALLQEIHNLWDMSQIRPYEGHLISGRQNDGREGLLVSLGYQAKVAWKALKESHRIGRGR